MKFQPLIGTAMSGSLGGVTASHNRNGAYFRSRVKPTKPNTQNQNDARSAFTIVTQSWRGLTPDQITAWNTAAAGVVVTTKKGTKSTPTGQQYYMLTNQSRQRLGLDLLSDPPQSYEPNFAFTPPVCTLDSTGLLTITPGDAESWNAEGGGLILSTSGPVGNGQTYVKIPYALAQIVATGASSYTDQMPFGVTNSQKFKLAMRALNPNGTRSNLVNVTVGVGLSTITRVAEGSLNTGLQVVVVFDQPTLLDPADLTDVTTPATCVSAVSNDGGVTWDCDMSVVPNGDNVFHLAAHAGRYAEQNIVIGADQYVATIGSIVPGAPNHGTATASVRVQGAGAEIGVVTVTHAATPHASTAQVAAGTRSIDLTFNAFTPSAADTWSKPAADAIAAGSGVIG